MKTLNVILPGVLVSRVFTHVAKIKPPAGRSKCVSESAAVLEIPIPYKCGSSRNIKMCLSNKKKQTRGIIDTNIDRLQRGLSK